jgi:hypothetical protein
MVLQNGIYCNATWCHNPEDLNLKLHSIWQDWRQKSKTPNSNKLHYKEHNNKGPEQG